MLTSISRYLLVPVMGALVASVLAGAQLTYAQTALQSSEERSTMESIPLQSLDQDAMANTVIEGGLAPLGDPRPEPSRPLAEGYSPYNDPLLLHGNDTRSGFNRFSLNFEINYQDPKNIPGIEFGNAYRIAPLPANRTYDHYEFSTTER